MPRRRFTPTFDRFDVKAVPAAIGPELVEQSPIDLDPVPVQPPAPPVEPAPITPMSHVILDWEVDHPGQFETMVNSLTLSIADQVVAAIGDEMTCWPLSYLVPSDPVSGAAMDPNP